MPDPTDPDVKDDSSSPNVEDEQTEELDADGNPIEPTDEDNANLDDPEAKQGEGDDDAEAQANKRNKRNPGAEARIQQLINEQKALQAQLEELKPHAEKAKRFAGTIADFEKSGLTSDSALSDAALRQTFNQELNGIKAQLQARIDIGDLTFQDANNQYMREEQDRLQRLQRAQSDREIAQTKAELETEKQAVRKLRYDTVLEKAAARYKLPEYALDDVRELVADPDKVEDFVKRLSATIAKSRQVAVNNSAARGENGVANRTNKPPTIGSGENAAARSQKRSGAEMTLSEAFEASRAAVVGKKRT